MNVNLIATDRVIPYARNPRRNDGAVAKVAASIREFGWRQPIVVDRDMVVVAGHTRLLAARQLGLTEVPVHVATELTPQQAKAYRLADNRLAEEADWDRDLLSLELEDLKALGVDLEITGFDDDELDHLMGKENDGLTDPDHAPEPPTEPITKPGDLWIIGNHRLLCGDATKIVDLERVLDGSLADLCFTDPPYNVDYAGGAVRKKDRRIANDALGDQFGQFLRDAMAGILTVTKGAVYVCMSSSELHTLQRAWTEAGGHWSTFIIWAKDRFTLGRSDYQRQYEPILYGWKAGSDHFWCGARDQGDVWTIARPAKNDLHPTMKPVELVERAVRNSSKTRDIVLDPFGGSGTTLIACERTNRQARLVELDPRYCDVIVKRWEDFTGSKAALQPTSQPRAGGNELTLGTIADHHDQVAGGKAA